MSENNKVLGYLPQDTPPIGATLSLGLQQVLTMFPATVLVAILTRFDIGTTLLASGLGTIIALLVSKRRIPMYYGSSFSYLAVIMAAGTNLGIDCGDLKYCPDVVQIVQVGIILTGVLNILIGLLVQKAGKKALDVVLPPIITGSMAITIGIALAGVALGDASNHWGVAFITLIATILFSVFLRGKGLLGMLPILFGAMVGYAAAAAFNIIDYTTITGADWLVLPNVTLPAFGNPEAWGMGLSIALIAIATIPESTAHLYQMSLYIDELAKELGKPELKIKNLIGLNLVADGCNDIVNGFLGGCAGTNYGENNSLMAITRNYSVPVLMTAGAIAIALAFLGKLAGIVYSIPTAVTGGLSIYLFGVIGMQGLALIQSEKVDLFNPKNLAIGAVILITGIGGNMILPGGSFVDFAIPYLFPNGIPAIVFAAILGIALNLIFILFEKKEKAA
ncbi:MAG: solute carrier family 23 protein [Anaerolineae bacterium]|nr:solute carrier family 23 protein [Anaerolineae bacterium]